MYIIQIMHVHTMYRSEYFNEGSYDPRFCFTNYDFIKYYLSEVNYY